MFAFSLCVLTEYSAVLESRKDDLELSHLNLILHSFETRDDRAALAEAEIKRLTESFSRLREDLLPIFRMVKESKVSCFYFLFLFLLF